MGSRNKSWLRENSGAVIGAFAVIVAALITSGYLKPNPSDKSTEVLNKNTNVTSQSVVPKSSEEASSVISDSPFNLDEYKDLYQFAYGGSGMNMTASDATAFADSWFEFCADKDISKFKEVYTFAYSGGGMNKTGEDAKDWALNSVGCDI
ncbi:TPA: hypothetical protein N2817_004489 [Vibrio parahaemolyticus]|nr:hypothetical protein [Vibrio parahaemolyticus]